LYQGKFPEVVAPLARVVEVGNWAWSVHVFFNKQRIKTADGLILT